MTASITTPERHEIPSHEASDLEWLFGQGGATFERSPTGAVLERLLRDSCGAAKCRICKGRGLLSSTAAVVRARATKHHREHIERGELKREDGVLVYTSIHEFKTVGLGSWCGACGGTGYVPKRTPKGSTAHGEYDDHNRLSIVGGLDARPGSTGGGETARSEPDSAALVRFARTSRRLSLLNERQRLILWAYHGDVGARWGREPSGRIFALFPLTKGGKSLLGPGKGVDGGGGIAGAAERLWSVVAAHLSQPHHRTHAALERADSEAREILAEAAAAWVATDYRRSDAAFLAEVERRYPPPKPAWDTLLDEIDSWAGDDDLVPGNESWVGAPSKGTDGVWR